MRRTGWWFLSNPRYPGRITEIHFTDGADLKKDDPLFTIDPRPFKAQLDAAEPIWPSPGPLWISPGSSLPRPGPRGVQGHCQADL